MGFLNSVGDVIKKIGKWVAKNPEIVVEGVEAGAEILGNIKDKIPKHNDSEDKLSLESLKNECEVHFALTSEIVSKVTSLEEDFNNKIDAIAVLQNDQNKVIEENKKIFSDSVQEIKKDIEEMNNDYILYKKKTKTTYLITSVVGGIGIVVAIILAILV